MKSVMIQCLRGSWARGQRTSAAFHVGGQKNMSRAGILLILALKPGDLAVVR